MISTNTNYPDFVSTTHYGEGDGLGGWNCTETQA